MPGLDLMDSTAYWPRLDATQLSCLKKKKSSFKAKFEGDERVISCLFKVEMHALWQQKKLREFCMEKGIHVSAYSPLGGRDAPWGTNKVMECEVLKEIAKAKGKTVAQVSFSSFLSHVCVTRGYCA